MLIAMLMLYFNSDMRILAAVSDAFGTGEGRLAFRNAHVCRGPAPPGSDRRVEWARLHVNEQVERQLGMTHVNTDAGKGFKLVRMAGPNADRPLNVSIERGNVTEAAALFDEPAHRVTVLVPREATANDVITAIQSNPVVAGAVGAVLPNGSTARAGQLVDLVLPAVDHNPTQFAHFDVSATRSASTNTVRRCDLGTRLMWWAFLLFFIGFAIKVPSVPVPHRSPMPRVEAPTRSR